MVERIEICLPNLPGAFDGTTVAVISDVHAGVRRGGDAGVRSIVEQANATCPDIIVLLGDLVHLCYQHARYMPLFAGLRARDGVWACLGNHEHGSRWFSRHLGERSGPSVDEWRRVYADLGIELLANEARPIERDGSRIWLVGVDDVYTGRDDLSAALQQTQAGEFRLAISHHPDLVDDPEVSEVDLVLAGHTHGGQVLLPVLGPVYVSSRKPRERARGLVRTGGTLMYVTRGVGEGLPIRFACPREMPLITLRRGEAEGTAAG